MRSECLKSLIVNEARQVNETVFKGTGLLMGKL